MLAISGCPCIRQAITRANGIVYTYEYWSSVYWEKVNSWFSSVTWNSTAPAATTAGSTPAQEPVPSLRLKNIADGLEDYDLLRMAEERFGANTALKRPRSRANH
ncbi:MAG: DUF4091 domain-containing protein [Oscillospiraceae bacterium]|nr:DUF4091 domain-containing protein [Oscillospiraceae bacterium]